MPAECAHAADALFAAYPQLEAAITRAAGGTSWQVIGVSALATDGSGLYLEITKPAHWRRTAEGRVVGGIGALGGSLEPGETLLEGLRRELLEEIGAQAAVEPSSVTHLVYQESWADTLSLPDGGHPAPVLCTIGRDRRPPQQGSPCRDLAIVTYVARLREEPRLRDLYGWLRLPLEALSAALAPEAIECRRLAAMPGVRLATREPLDPEMLLAPVWTVRSLQVLARARRLEPPIIDQGADA